MLNNAHVPTAFRHLAALVAVGLVATGCAIAPEPKAKPVARAKVDGSLNECVETLRKLGNPTARQAVDACANLWKEPSCRAAWEKAPAMPKGERPELIVSACRQAYCPILPFKPNLCTTEGVVDLAARQPPWMQYWADFSGMALASGLNMEPAPELREFGRMLLTLVVLAD